MPYLGILVYFLSTVLLCTLMLILGHFLGGRSYSRYKNVPFESGIESIGSARLKFSIKFYLVAISFVIFDVEGLYLYIWALSIRKTGWVGFSEIFVFVFILLITLIYLVRVGVFNWTKKLLK